MKSNRTVSFCIIAAAYLLAAVIAVLVWKVLPNTTPLLRVLIADVAATVAVYIFSLIVKNASLYDPYWSVQPLVIVPALLITTKNVTASAIILLCLITIWGVRLTANWAYTFKNLTVQDWRYDNIAKATGKFFFAVNFLGIQLMPTLIVFSCMTPVIMVFYRASHFNALCLIGIALSLFGVVLETVADTTKHAFRAQGNKGIVDVGIWKRHRHPNYAGEVVFWWGIYLVVLFNAPSLWWTGFGAIANSLLFHFISIPLAERQSELRHGEQWKEYKSRSFMF